MSARRALVFLALLGALLGKSATASAHDVRGEVVFLDVGDHAVDLEVHVPPLQLELARGVRPGSTTATSVTVDQAVLRRHAEAHIGARTRDGRAFLTTVRGIELVTATDHDELVVRVHLEAPPDADARWFELREDLVLSEVVSATAYVFLRTDLQTGMVGEAPALIGALHYQQRALVVDRTAGTRWRSFVTAVHLGVTHIAAGTDHLLFLLVLLLPAPLLAAAGRWRGTRAVRASLGATARTVTAFTLGHSLTLVIGAVHGPVLPAAVVEPLIGVSILITAIHALRPVLPGREAVIAALFGLVHGLAFATTLTGLGVDGGSLALGVAGFNLGVELMQLAALTMTVPWLLLLARHAAVYRAVRITTATGAGIAALAWIAARTGALVTPIPGLVERGAHHAPWLVTGLALLALASTRRAPWAAAAAAERHRG